MGNGGEKGVKGRVMIAEFVARLGWFSMVGLIHSLCLG